MPVTSTETMRVLEPAPNILAFYEGRISGRRLHSTQANWLDDGAYSLGIASYAIVSGDEALVYDTGISIAHGKAIRADLEKRGVTSIRVVLSHYHNDHVAGTAAFSDCEIIASEKTRQRMEEVADEFARDDPPIDPLIMPTSAFDGIKCLRIGSIDIELRPLDIHSFDGVALYLPQRQLLLAGDALEDTITYVAEPSRLHIHLTELERLSTWDIKSILPCHGDPKRIEQGGYDVSLIEATTSYITKLLRCREEPELAEISLSEFVEESIGNGSVIYFDAYEEVHRQNLKAIFGQTGL